MTADYSYVRPDVLDEPNTYYYSSYGGRDFLLAWRAQRDSVLSKLPAPTVHVPPSSKRVSPDGDTAAMIESALFALAHGTRGRGMEIAERLLRKFEATRKLYRAYDASFKPVDQSDFRDLPLYLRLGEMLALGYQMQGDIRYLNALLKCNDILCSLCAQLDEDAQSRLAALILNERKSLESLATKKGRSN